MKGQSDKYLLSFAFCGIIFNMKDEIVIKGARENNLKNINLTLPRNKFIVFTGVSGSGKTSLAFGTIFAEGQRKYMESLSSYARMFLGQSQKPDVDSIEGLSPAISIDQKTTNHNPRSTVGTVTEIYDYFRLLFANIGTPYCPNCHKPIKQQTIDQIVDGIKAYGEGTKVSILAPVVHDQKGTFQNLLESLKRSGYARVEVDGNTFLLEDEINLDKNVRHNINVIVDRISIKEGKDTRLAGSVESALKLAEGLVVAKTEDKEELFSINYACPTCGWALGEITPRLFSFNAPYGACPTCLGLGYTTDIDERSVLKYSNLSIRQGAFDITGWKFSAGGMARAYFEALSKKYDISLDIPVAELEKDKIKILLYGTGKEEIELILSNEKNDKVVKATFEGIVNNLRRRYNETNNEWVKFEINRFMREQDCPTCHGKRLNESALSIKINGKDIFDFCNQSVKNLLPTICGLKLDKTKEKIAEPIVKEIHNRLQFLDDVGLGYLTLTRSAETLSGGESQRIRLATQIGSGLVGVLYILDEPSIGLHQRDNEKLLRTLKNLKDLGNTLIVVEHDEDTIRSADYLVDVGPYAGVNGGEIVASGTVEEVKKCKDSVTAKFLRGEDKIEVPKTRRKPKDFIEIVGAKENNLKNINVKIPTGVFTAVTGVSGSGKSSLINRILFPYLSNILNNSKLPLGNCKNIKNFEVLDKVINIDQAPIGRTPRSNPATYTGVFTAIRELFASTIDAKVRGYNAGRFSFNVKGGRCEACEGAGVKEIEMYFLPDITVPCEICKGKRYNRETLEVKYKGKTISDVLDMTVEEALKFFENIPSITNKLQSLYDVGLSYIKLGQPATELSGGEAQRVKLATELSKRETGKTMYILDEPTTGLHIYDIKKLIKILNRLIGNGNSVIVIEHNLDVIKCADYVIDLGPEGGDDGGTVVITGTPERVAKCKESYTGQFLRKILNS